MNAAEFRSWFEGFDSIARIDDEIVVMTPDQRDRWITRVREMVMLLDEVPTPYPVFVEKFWPFPVADDVRWWRRWFAQWSLPWRAHHVAMAGDARRFVDACQAFRQLGRIEGEGIFRSL
jgi:hypothetical protein